MDKITEAPSACQLQPLCGGYCETPREVKLSFCKKCLIVHDQHWSKAQGEVISFGYTNYRGEFAQRRATPIRFEFGETEHHPEPQWLMVAIDHDRSDIRYFALSAMVLYGPNLNDVDLNEMFHHWDNHERKPKPPYSTINMRTERSIAFAAGAKATQSLALKKAESEIARLRAACAKEFESVQTLDNENQKLRSRLAEMARCEAALNARE